MKFQCVFSDIDGTLLNTSHQITKATKNKIKELHEKHIPFILVSARMPKGIRFLQEELEIDDPIICYSGGLILDKNKVIYSQTIEQEKTLKLLTFLKQQAICTTVYFHDHWLVYNSEDKWIIQESKITGIIPELIDFKSIHEVHKILCMGESEAISILEKQLKQLFPSLSIYKSKPTYLEIMDGTISKSKAIKIVCKDKQISIKKSVSFGDNYNDIDMLEVTKWGFAMKNAPEDVLKRIPMHTLSNDEDGIVYALNDLMEE